MAVRRISGGRAAGVLWAAYLVMAVAEAPPAHAQAAPLEAPLVTTSVASAPIAGDFTIAAVGDLIYLRPMSKVLERQSPAMVAILRGADVTFGNFEASAFDLASFGGAPQAESGGRWLIADPRVPEDLAKMGFDLISHANNHGTDWGVEGLLETDRLLDDAGLVHAGSGKSLSVARSPRYLDTARGRIALIAATSSYVSASRAADAFGEVPARPGVNALRSRQVIFLAKADLAVLARITHSDSSKSVFLGDAEYREGAPGANLDDVSYEINPDDEAENLLSIRQAKGNSNFVVFSLHNHESGNASATPAEFAITLARGAIDQGADAVVGHGPHQLRGIEIYKGKPIFYSLGNFAFMTNSLDVVPRDTYEQYGIPPGTATVPEMLKAYNAVRFSKPEIYESLIAVSRYVAGGLAEVRLYPVDLGLSASGADKGVPHLADSSVGLRILQRVQTLSRPFGTKIDIEKGVGVIRVAVRSQS
jgi:poly-gamma-glutamate capsule biosynthesis protein CapA/YwtB (metallophosphatase superfamily)